MRRVVVTGLGAVTPVGNDVESFWNSIREGRCGIAPITAYDTSDRSVKLAAEVKDLDAARYLPKKELRKLDRSNVFALAAAAQAMEDAGIDAPGAGDGQGKESAGENRDRWGVIMGSGIGGFQTIEEEKEKGMAKGYDRVSPFFIPKAIANMSAGHIAIRYGLHGVCSCTVTACASAANSIGDAFRQIRDGYMDLMVAGGTEAAITPLAIGGFSSMKALSTATDPSRASIPFDAERDGFVMGEGAAVLVLEEYERAVKRGARIYAEICGFGTNCDAYHITAPAPDGTGASACMRLAMQDAGISPESVDYINAHGTSTAMNDKGESAAIHAVFGDRADPETGSLCVSSTKSMTGHLLGASAAVEAVITIKAVHEGYMPPTINYRVPDPECLLDVVPNQGRGKEIRYALSNSLGFGGHNATLVFGKYREEK